MQQLFFKPGANQDTTFARPPSDFINFVALTAGVSQDIPVPDGANFAIFSADGDFYAKPGDAEDENMDTPSATVTDGSAPELNPLIWNVEKVGFILLVSGSNRKITISFYA